MGKRKRKRMSDLPTDEAIRKLFPRKVVEEADKVAHEKDDEAVLHDKDSVLGE